MTLEIIKNVDINCPSCGKSMIRRDGKFGIFYGCSGFPRCRQVLKQTQVDSILETKEESDKISISWTDEQQGLFEWGIQAIRELDNITSTLSLRVVACAGSGKTTTIVEKIRVMKEKAIELRKDVTMVYLVFNSSNRDEAVKMGLPAMTAHQYCFKAILNWCRRLGIPNPEIKKNKAYDICNKLLGVHLDTHDWMIIPCVKLVGLCKNTATLPNPKSLEYLIRTFSVDIDLPEGEKVETFYDFVTQVFNYSLNKPEILENKFLVNFIDDDHYNILDSRGNIVVTQHRLNLRKSFWSKEQKIDFILDKYSQELEQVKYYEGEVTPNLESIDFNDMLYYPLYFKLPLPRYDVVVLDEVQDWNRTQIYITKRAVKKTGILIFVGDPNQSCYHFRGAMPGAMDDLAKSFENTVSYPLSFTFRVPKVGVALINKEFPDIPFNCLPSAIEGEIEYIEAAEMLDLLKVGDAVICRLNAPLIVYVLQLLRKGIKAHIVGTDLKGDLLSIINKNSSSKRNSIDKLRSNLQLYKSAEVARLKSQGDELSLSNLYDKLACVKVLSDKCSVVKDVIAKIKSVFDVGKNAISFMSIHASKGGEWNRVFSLNDDMMPLATKSYLQHQQEKNLQYIVWTRFKEKLFIVASPDKNNESIFDSI